MKGIHQKLGSFFCRLLLRPAVSTGNEPSERNRGNLVFGKQELKYLVGCFSLIVTLDCMLKYGGCQGLWRWKH